MEGGFYVERLIEKHDIKVILPNQAERDYIHNAIYNEFTQGQFKNSTKDKFIEMLKIAGSDAGRQWGQSLAQSLENNDMISLAKGIKEDELYKNVLEYKIVEETKEAFEIKYTECLWAKTFREVDASDIGYAALCYSDYEFTRAFNPGMKMIRPKTLMQGDDCCNCRFIMEA